MRVPGAQVSSIRQSVRRSLVAVVSIGAVVSMGLLGSAPPAAASPSCISSVKQTLPAHAVRSGARPMVVPNCNAPTPGFSTPVRTTDGFTVNVTNYDATFTWEAVVSVGSGSVAKGSASGLTLPLTVTGVAAGASATIRVTTSKLNYINGSNTVSGQAISAALTPIFDDPVSTADGFTVHVTNYDAAFTWGASASFGSVAKGTPSGSSLLLTVTALSADTKSKVTVTTTRTGYVGGTEDVVGVSLSEARTPTYGIVSRTSDGFVVSITNYDDNWTWAATVTSGQVAKGTPLGDTFDLTVTGLAASTEATITTTATRTDYATGTANQKGTSQGAARVPTFDTPVGTVDGFTVNVTNYNDNWTWTPKFMDVDVVKGTPVGATLPLTVTGMHEGDEVTIWVLTGRDGYVRGSASVRGTAGVKEIPDSPGVTPEQPGRPEITPIEKNAGQQPGRELTTVGGQPVQVTVEANDDHSGLIITGPGFRMVLTGLTASGGTPPIGSLGQLVFLENGMVSFTGSGFEPGTYAYVYLFSDPKLIGRVLVGADGTFSGTMAMPVGVHAGQHTLQVNGLTTTNEVRSVSMGVEVAAVAPAVAPVTMTVVTRVYFPYESAVLSASAKRALDRMVGQVPTTGKPHSVVVGVVRSTGADAADVALATKRAHAVAGYLTSQGLPSTIKVRTQKATVGNTPKDRRVHITITFTQ